MAWASVSPWIVTLGAAATLAGSVKPRLSPTRALHRWLVAPLALTQMVVEDQHDHLVADAAIGTIAFAGSVLVVAGANVLGWVLVGISIGALLLGSMLDWSPVYCLIKLLARAIR